jgi:hypothetical protein
MPTCVQPAKWDYYSSGGTLGTFGTPNVGDPVQGAYLKNCSLISAFASLAWKGNVITQPSGPASIYTFQFYNPNKTITTDGRTPLDAYGKLMHAKSDTSTEIWPALYEKAYYMWLDNKVDPARPDYCKYTGWQSPVTVLNQLTGKTVSQKSCLSSSADAIFTEINNWCSNFNPIATNRTIKTPAVAWTYDPTISNPNGAVYSDTTIAAQHTYSLLGVTGVKSGTTWTQKYIVLRNPYGKGKGDPVMAAGDLYTGSLWCNFNLGVNDGLFALRYDLFKKYFDGYAWTI